MIQLGMHNDINMSLASKGFKCKYLYPSKMKISAAMTGWKYDALIIVMLRKVLTKHYSFFTQWCSLHLDGKMVNKNMCIWMYRHRKSAKVITRISDSSKKKILCLLTVFFMQIKVYINCLESIFEAHEWSKTLMLASILTQHVSSCRCKVSRRDGPALVTWKPHYRLSLLRMTATGTKKIFYSKITFLARLNY